MKPLTLRYPIRFYIEGGLLILFSLILIFSITRFVWNGFNIPPATLPQNLPGMLVFNGDHERGRPCFLCEDDIFRTIPASFQVQQLATEAGSFLLSPDGAQIAWHSGGSIYTAHIKSGLTTQIVASGNYPVWSPDSQRLVYQDAGNLMMVYADGTDSQVVLDGHTAPFTIDRHADLSWSYDGTRLVLGEDGALYILQLSSRQLSHFMDIGWLGDPVWSPRGEQIAYIHQGVHVVDSTTGSKLLFDGDGKTFAWSPDGQRLAISTSRHIAIVDMKSNTRTYFQMATEEGGQAFVDTFSWSPDGRYLAFDGHQCQQSDFDCRRDRAYLVDTWQTPPIPREIETLTSVFDPQFSWSPDGQYLAYINDNRLMIVNLTTLQRQQVVLDNIRLPCCGSLGWTP